MSNKRDTVGLVITANPDRKNHDSIQPIIGKGLAMSSISAHLDAGVLAKLREDV